MKKIAIVFITFLLASCAKEDSEPFYNNYEWTATIQPSEDSVRVAFVGVNNDTNFHIANKDGVKFGYRSFTGKKETAIIIYGRSNVSTIIVSHKDVEQSRVTVDVVDSLVTSVVIGRYKTR